MSTFFDLNDSYDRYNDHTTSEHCLSNSKGHYHGAVVSELGLG